MLTDCSKRRMRIARFQTVVCIFLSLRYSTHWIFLVSATFYSHFYHLRSLSLNQTCVLSLSMINWIYWSIPNPNWRQTNAMQTKTIFILFLIIHLNTFRFYFRGDDAECFCAEKRLTIVQSTLAIYSFVFRQTNPQVELINLKWISAVIFLYKTIRFFFS